MLPVCCPKTTFICTSSTQACIQISNPLTIMNSKMKHECILSYECLKKETLYLVQRFFFIHLIKLTICLYQSFLAHSLASPFKISSPCFRDGSIYSSASLTAFGLPGRFTISVSPRMPAIALESMALGVIDRE